MTPYDWSKENEEKQDVRYWPVNPRDRNRPDPNTPMLLTDEEIDRAQDRFRMGREIVILEKIDHISFWLEFMQWYEGAA